jgi:hypothetical protein
MNDNWIDIKLLNISYKNLINNYFSNYSGKYKIENNILLIDIDSWGIEKFFIKDYMIKDDQLFYNIHYNNFDNIHSISILVQIGNWNIFQKMENYLNNFDNIHCNIYFTIINELITDNNINYLKNKFKKSVILSGENKGMDIGLFFIALHYIKKNNYLHDYYIKIHTKTNDNFREESLNNLIGSYDKIIQNIKLLSKENIGMISGNIIYKYKINKDVFNSNFYYLKKLIKYLYNEDINYDNLEFCGGTFFISKNFIFNIFTLNIIENIYNSLNNLNTLDYHWYSIFYKIKLNDLDIIYKDYLNNKNNKFPNNLSLSYKKNKPGLRDSMIEHAIERLFGYICKKNILNII